MSDPRPDQQVTPPGTDFVVYGTGAGANIEDMPSYLSDPQRQTGNLPGLARSSFNNRVQRQGAFVAAAISTFVWEVLSIYVPDNGDLDNYVANFKAALRAYITPEGEGLPGGPYLPIAGGEMLGDINFHSGATIVLAYNYWLRAKDSSGVSHGMLMYGIRSGDTLGANHYIGDGSAPYVIFGSNPLVNNGVFWGARDTGGAAHSLLGLQNDNNTYITAWNALYVKSNNMWVESSIIIRNGDIFYTKNAAGAPTHMLTTRSDNITQIAYGAPGPVYIYSLPGSQIVLVGQVSVTGTLYPNGNVSIGGSLDAGPTTMRSSLQVNGATNMYARLNVNNGVGATITGDIATNSIRIYGAGIVSDGTNTLYGTTYITYTRIYNPGNNDPCQIYADPGLHARCTFHVGGVRIWTAGTAPSGNFVIADENAGAYRLVIDTAGSGSIAGNWSVGNVIYGAGLSISGQTSSNTIVCNYITNYGNIACWGALYFGNTGYYINYIGSGFLYTVGHYRVQGQLEAYGHIVGSGHLYLAGEIHAEGRAYVGDLWARGNLFASNDAWFYLGNDAAKKYLNFHPYRNIFWDRYDGSLWWSSDFNQHVQFQFGGEWYLKNWLGPMYARFFAAQGLVRGSIQEKTMRSVESAINVIAALNPIQYKQVPRLRQRHNAPSYYLDEEPDEIGFLVEEVKEVLPQAVVETEPMPEHLRAETKNPELSPYALRPDVILAVAVKAIQEMNERLARLERMVVNPA